MQWHERYLKGVLRILMRMQRGQAVQGQPSPCLNSTILFSNLTYFFLLPFFFFLSEAGALQEPVLSAISELFVGV